MPKLFVRIETASSGFSTIIYMYVCYRPVEDCVYRPKSPKLLNYRRTFYKNRSEPDRTGQD